MAAGGPRERIEAPRQSPPSTSLLATLNALGRLDGTLTTTAETDEPQIVGDRVTGPELRWPNGVAFDPDYCGGVHLLDPCDPAELPEPDDCPPVRTFDPFEIVATVKRSTLDRGVDLEGQARRLLAQCQHGAVGAEFWSGEFARANGYDDNGYLADSNADIVENGDPIAALDALAALEEALAATSSYACGCGQRGMIHAPPSVVTVWAYQGVVQRSNGLLLTALDTIVVTGPGYVGDGPGDSDGPVPPAAGTGWAYATGLPVGRLGPVTVLDSVDHQTNVRYVQAQRAGMVVWDGCCQTAVLVNQAERE